uniref:Structural maintenance of chromosomes protein n=1 Tax=Timema tahoe TaxID=61484 RepID=A0A7R9FLX6_9NEOP|nr:unnamed protein product [Timema tahoe]
MFHYPVTSSGRRSNLDGLAIQFVLSDEFSHLRPEQRQALLHEGTGPRVLNAYVEIIFDNSDGRLPIDKDEVFLRRVIGAKKDQYFLNKKVVPRSDVMNLLESAGFSRSNPYYIVKQGKINQMATAPDSYRLKLLREVAGTRVYDERREESKAILKETEGKVDKIEEFLRTIEERLKTLEEEKEELKEYQKWDKMRRSLEYTIHDRELKETRKKLDDMEAARKNSGEEQKKYSAELKVAQEAIRSAARRLKETKKNVQAHKEERDTLSAEQQQLLKEKTKLELTIKDLSDEVMGDNTSKERAENELKKLKVTIAQKEADLEKITPQYENMKKKEEECTRELALKEQKRKELYAKQGRGSQFTSKEERDLWIQKELNSIYQIQYEVFGLAKVKWFNETSICPHAREHSSKQRRYTPAPGNELDQTHEMERQRCYIDELNKQYYELKKAKDQCQSTRNELWRKENTIQQTLSSLKEDLAKADQSLRSMAGKPILNGRDSVRKVLETFRERGGAAADIANSYYGPVIENFDCEKSIYTAVEVTAGNRLFHHIVDSDKVGTQILKEMNRQKLPGEVTFMPLNRLHVKEQNYPNTNDAIPMVTKLNYELKYDKALRYIFGKTLICRNLEVATHLAKTSGLDCVTLEGDQVSSKGSLTGGYFNTSRSRLEIQKTRSELNAQIRESEEELAKLRENLRETESKINHIVSEMQKTETKNSKAKDIFDKVKADIRLMKEEQTGIERYKLPKERSLEQYASSMEAMKTTKDGLESELHQELMSQLSVSDQLEVDKLNDDIRRLTQENKEAFSLRMRLEAEKNKLENLLTNNLMRRKDELVQALQEISVEDRKRQLENCKSELIAIEKRIDEVNKEFKNMEKKVQEAMKMQKSEQQAQDKGKTKEKEIQEKIQEDAKDLEKMASKQNTLQSKIADCTKKIQELGSLPSPEIYAKYQNLSTKNTHVGRKKVGECVPATIVAVERKEVPATGELVTDGFENMDCAAVQAVERVGGAACASSEKRDKGQLNSEAQQALCKWIDSRPFPEHFYPFRMSHYQVYVIMFQLFKEMEKANSHLKKYSHVNKKALDQFMSFSDQKEKLVKRKEELDRGDEKIKELMLVLEQRKYEAIEFTFKQVSKYFSEVFHKLVPSGHAQLVMRRNEDEAGGSQDKEQYCLTLSLSTGTLPPTATHVAGTSFCSTATRCRDFLMFHRDSRCQDILLFHRDSRCQDILLFHRNTLADLFPTCIHTCLNTTLPLSRHQSVTPEVAERDNKVESDSDKFTGVGIRVSFTGRNAEMREMNQLSGGQKSLVALGLIFSIQKCDPAPFYLFDEIDQALDSQHRMAVADMIHELSRDAQFITTTFRPELLVHANKFYGVKFRNKVSHVECVSREEAADFVEDDTTHG